jgi:hypothetical protein
MEYAHTKHAGCVFEVKDRPDGTFWLTLSIDGPGIGIRGNGFIGLEFRRKLTMREADDFAAMLNREIN